MSRIDLLGVRKSFGRQRVIPNMDLTLEAGQLTVLVGPSGCGKSTLLRLIAGLEEPDSGEIRFDGNLMNAVPPGKRGIGMVFQSYALYPHMTVAKNLAFPLQQARLSRDETGQRVEEVARLLHIGDLLERKPAQLSGGQRQRVAIGRALVRRPRILLMDEPLSNLDANLRVQMRVEIRRLQQQTGATLVYVTHDQAEAMTLADSLVVLRAGKAVQAGAPLALYNRPSERFVAEFLGSPPMNLAEAVLDTLSGMPVLDLGKAGCLPWPAGIPCPDALEKVTVGVRPEHLALGASGDSGLQGVVAAVEPLGDRELCHVALQGHPAWVVVLPPGQALEPGDRVALTPSKKADTLHLFDAEGRRLRL